MKVWQLRDDPDRAEDGKRRCNDFITNAGHHITAAGGDFIYRHRQRNPRVLETRQLTGGKSIPMNHPATTFQAQQNLIGLPDYRQNS